jgi:hypothetical protein
MNKPFEMGLMAGLIAATVLAMLQPALAKKAPVIPRQPRIFYRLPDDLRCVERSFSISVGNPAYKTAYPFGP